MWNGYIVVAAAHTHGAYRGLKFDEDFSSFPPFGIGDKGSGTSVALHLKHRI